MEGNDFVEAVHIELPDEGGHVGMFVVVGQQTAGELRLVSDPERSAIVCPADVVIYHIVVLLPINILTLILTCFLILHHLPELGKECRHIARYGGDYDLHQRHDGGLRRTV